jgi:hypothetical protein
MDKLYLKNGREAQISIWDFRQIEHFASQNLPTYDLNNMGDKSFVGFAYLGPSLPYDLKRVDPKHVYSEETDLSPLEIQAQTDLRKEEYHRAITASVDQALVGILTCQWVKFHEDFWHYHVRWIDVHEDYKNQRVGTNLVRALDDVEFVKGKILSLGMLSIEGTDHIARVIKRDLKARDYALVFEGYVGHKPTSFGVYGGEFWG